MHIPRLLPLCLFLAALIAGCGGDDEERAATSEPAQTASAPSPQAAPQETTETTSTAAADDAPTISRADARGAGRPPTARAADKVPNSDLYFLDVDDVTCEAPDADQPDNLNERSAEWSCTLDSEVNGVRCQGSYTVKAVGEDRYSSESDVTAADVSCAPA